MEASLDRSGQNLKTAVSRVCVVLLRMLPFQQRLPILLSRRCLNMRVLEQDEFSWTAMISQHTKLGQGRQALRIYKKMQETGVRPSSYTFVAALKACSSLHDLENCKRIHVHVLESGFASDLFVGTMLVDVYAKCGSLVNARTIFEKMPHRNVVSWNAMILGYTKMQASEVAWELFERMQHEGVMPDDRTYVLALKACSSLALLEEGKEEDRELLKQRALEQARSIHFDAMKQGFATNLFVVTMLVDVYAKCGSLVDARHVFEDMPQRDVVVWNAMILGYAQTGDGEVGLELYVRMQQEGVVPNDRTLVAALKACSNLICLKGNSVGDVKLLKEQCLEKVRGLHSAATKGNYDSDLFVGNMLVDVYSKCGSLVEARCVFENMLHRDVISWNAMISGYVQMDNGEAALGLYTRMQHEGMVLNNQTFVAALKACSSLAQLEQGCEEQVKVIHSKLRKSGSEPDMFVRTMLVDLYGKCGCLVDARHVFEEMPQRDVVSWNAMILGYAQMEESEEALKLYTLMQQEGVAPDGWTFVGVLKACSSMAGSEGWNESDKKKDEIQYLHVVRAIHLNIVRSELESDIFVRNALLTAYMRCGSLEDARHVFDNMPHRDVVTWTAMIWGCAQLRKGEEALQLLTEMQQAGVVPEDQTFFGALKACSSIATLDERTNEATGAREVFLQRVRALHSAVAHWKFASDVFVGNILVDVYVKCGSLVDARRVFEKMPHRDVVSWNAMILGYAQMECGEVALELFGQMQQEGVCPNNWTFVAALKACGAVLGLTRGKEIHDQICKVGLSSTDLLVATSLIDMYCKCGSMDSAQQIFNAMPKRDVVPWNALIAGYATQGDSELVIQGFHRMRQEGVLPDSITFLSVLTVCSHVGLVDKGQKFFELMAGDYGISPTVHHYICMVDLFGRAGQLDRAMEMVKTMPFQPTPNVWRCVLAACRKWSMVELGRHAFDCAVKLDKNDATLYVLMSNIYAAANMLEEAREIQTIRSQKRAGKMPGQSWWTDFRGGVHAFMVGDRKHSRNEGIYRKLRDLFLKLKEDSML